MKKEPIQIENDRLIIRGLDDRDLKAIKAMREDPRIYRYEPTYLPELQGTAEDALDRLKNMDLHRDRQCVLGVYDKSHDCDFVGLAEFYDYKFSGKIVSLGCRFLPEYWGQGIATTCVAAMIAYLMDHTKVNLITAHVMPDNVASARCVIKNGFHHLLTKPEDWGHEGATIAEVYTLTAHLPELKDLPRFPRLRDGKISIAEYNKLRKEKRS